MKNLFDTDARNEIVSRLGNLTVNAERQWGKMDVSQMLRHCSHQLETALGEKQLHPNFIMKLLGPMFKKTLYEVKPFKRSLPTAPEFVVTDEREFEKEKQTLLTFVNRFHDDNGAVIGKKRHPVFGNLTKDQWGVSTFKHLDHHLSQFGV